MGVFIVGEAGEPFGQGEETDPSLYSGFLSEAIFGPITVQLLLGPNYSSGSGSAFFGDYASYYSQGQMTSLDVDSRFFHAGGRIIADIGAGTVSAFFKTSCWPINVFDAAQSLTIMGYNAAMGTSLVWTPYKGTTLNNMAFGAYTDITAVQNLGISFGYTGFMSLSDADDVDSVLWNGVDIRAQYTGIEGLSLSTHNNVSFAKGTDKEWIGWMRGDDSFFFSLYNALGLTKELTEKLSVNAEIGNLFVKTSSERSPELLAIFGTPGDVDYDNFWGQLKFIVSPAENTEFSVGLRFEGSKRDEEDLATVFSVPVGITVSF
jgi:hypothetical protein